MNTVEIPNLYDLHMQEMQERNNLPTKYGEDQGEAL